MSKRPDVKSLTDAMFEPAPATSTPPPPATPSTPAPGPDYQPTWRKRRRDYAGGKTMSEAEREQRYGRSLTVRVPGDLADRFYNAADRGGYRISMIAEAIIAAGLDAYERGEVQIGE